MINGNLLKRVMKEKGFNQTSLAEALGIKKQAVWKYLNGKATIGTKRMEQIIEVLGITETTMEMDIFFWDGKTPTCYGVDFKERLIVTMEKKKMSAATLAEKSGVSKACISTYMAGKYEAKKEHVDALARALEVNASWLMGFPTSMSYESFQLLECFARNKEEYLDYLAFTVRYLKHRLSMSDSGDDTTTLLEKNLQSSIIELIQFYQFVQGLIKPSGEEEK